MNCHRCLKLHIRLRRCDEYPQGWPTCEGRITVNGMPKHTDSYNPEKQRQKIADDYKASLRRLGYKI